MPPSEGAEILTETPGGPTTAGHCTNTKYYLGGLLPFSGQSWGGTDDFQVHAPDGWVPKNQWWVGSAWRTRSSTGSWYDLNGSGDYLCHFGWATGYGCGRTVSKYRMGAGVSQSASAFVEVAGSGQYPSLGAGGDSRGPWFNGYTAWGIHNGGGGPNPFGGNNGCFMAVHPYMFDSAWAPM